MGDLRIFNLQNYKLKYNINTFVETGTLHGDGVDCAKEFFTSIHSIEIDKELAEKALSILNEKGKIILTVPFGKHVWQPYHQNYNWNGILELSRGY